MGLRELLPLEGLFLLRVKMGRSHVSVVLCSRLSAFHLEKLLFQRTVAGDVESLSNLCA